MRRIIALAILFLLLGALINVAVAWGAALYCPADRNQFGGSFRVHELDPRSPRGGYIKGFAVSIEEDWLQMRGAPEGFGITESRSVIAAGWPKPSFTGTIDDHPLWFNRSTQITPWKGETHLRYQPRDRLEHTGPTRVIPLPGALRDVIPLRPLWFGFVFNTLFYALLLGLICLGPWQARRLIRRRRGQCERCAYPIGTSPRCTECGAPVS